MSMFVALVMRDFNKSFTPKNDGLLEHVPVQFHPEPMIGFLPVYATLEDLRADCGQDTPYTKVERKEREQEEGR